METNDVEVMNGEDMLYSLASKKYSEAMESDEDAAAFKQFMETFRVMTEVQRTNAELEEKRRIDELELEKFELEKDRLELEKKVELDREKASKKQMIIEFSKLGVMVAGAVVSVGLGIVSSRMYQAGEIATDKPFNFFEKLGRELLKTK